MGNSPMPYNEGANDNVVIPLTENDGVQAVMAASSTPSWKCATTTPTG